MTLRIFDLDVYQEIFCVGGITCPAFAELLVNGRGEGPALILTCTCKVPLAALATDFGKIMTTKMLQ